MKHGHHKQRMKGAALMDALAAMAVLAIGILGVGTLQGRTIEAGREAQVRITASRVADELLTLALVDPGHGACYQVPAGTGCTSASAAGAAQDWARMAARTLPAGSEAGAAFDGQRLEVTLRWPAKGGNTTHELKAITDVRP